MSERSYQVKEGLKSMGRVATATALGGPAVGGLVVLLEIGRSAAIALGGKEAGKSVSGAITALNVANSIDRR